MKHDITITDGITVTMELDTFDNAIVENHNGDQLFDILLTAIKRHKNDKENST